MKLFFKTDGASFYWAEKRPSSLLLHKCKTVIFRFIKNKMFNLMVIFSSTSSISSQLPLPAHMTSAFVHLHTASNKFCFTNIIRKNTVTYPFSNARQVRFLLQNATWHNPFCWMINWVGYNILFPLGPKKYILQFLSLWTFMCNYHLPIHCLRVPLHDQFHKHHTVVLSTFTFWFL